MDFLDRNLLVKAMSDRVGLWSSEAYIFRRMQADVQTLNFTHTRSELILHDLGLS
jgi:hypothetical protein